MTDLKKWRDDLNADDAEVRAAAAENLCHAGEDAAPFAVDLVRACADESDVQEWAVAALEQLGTPPASAADPLASLAKDANTLVAYWAVTLLGRLGPAAETGEDVLVDILTSGQDTAVKERAAWALGKIGAESKPAIDALRQAAGSKQARLARTANTALPQ